MGEAADQVGWQAKTIFERRMSVTENIPTHHTFIEPMGSLCKTIDFNCHFLLGVSRVFSLDKELGPGGQTKSCLWKYSYFVGVYEDKTKGFLQIVGWLLGFQAN